MKALVTGSAGFVGRHMVAELQRRGWDVAGVDLVATTGFRAWKGDALRVFDGAYYADEHFDLVVHAAAASPHRQAIDSKPITHIYNQALDAMMFSWAYATRQGRVLYLSSCAALDNTDDYGALKLTGERMARQAGAAGLPVTVVRPYSGYGEDQGEDWPFGAFAARARRRDDPFVIWGDGQQVRDWIHIDDVVNGALAVADSGIAEPVSLCTGIGTAMVDVARMLCDAAGYEPEFELRGDRPAGVPWRVGDPSALLKYYTPRVTLNEGVKRALA